MTRVLLIEPGAAGAPLLRESDTSLVPVIASSRSALQTLTDEGPQIIARLNEIFIIDHLTDGDQVTFVYGVRDKLRENERVMHQLANNSEAQALLGDFPKAVDDAILDSGEAYENQKLQLLGDPKKAAAFAKLVFDLLKAAS